MKIMSHFQMIFIMAFIGLHHLYIRQLSVYANSNLHTSGQLLCSVSMHVCFGKMLVLPTLMLERFVLIVSGDV